MATQEPDFFFPPPFFARAQKTCCRFILRGRVFCVISELSRAETRGREGVESVLGVSQVDISPTSKGEAGCGGEKDATEDHQANLPA